jgi:stage V sporulation protein AD
MTLKYNNVYINNTEIIAGPFEKEGLLSKYYDKKYDEFYFGEKTWEQAEMKLLDESINLLLKKEKKQVKDIGLFISGDLLNQLVSSNYVASRYDIPYLGIYSACATSVEGLIIASNMIEAKQSNNVIVSTSSHNNTAEKQFRYPIEYGGPKPKTTTFTVTGAASALLSNKKTGFKIESATIGKAVDSGVKEVFNMGGVMAIAAAQTIHDHLEQTNRKSDYYDLILTGDLGVYGKSILKEYMKKAYKINLDNCDDSACMIYDREKQDVYAGGSGPACLPLVAYGYVFKKMTECRIKKVLLVATGALMNPTTVNQKLSIPSIAHAISLEVIE